MDYAYLRQRPEPEDRYLHDVYISSNPAVNHVPTWILLLVLYFMKENKKNKPSESYFVWAVRRSALELEEELAPTYGTQLQYGISSVLETPTSRRGTKRSLFSRMRVPVILKPRCEFMKDCSSLYNALLDERQSSIVQ